eukprot:365700_1
MFELVKTASFISPAKPFTWKDLAGMKPYCAVVAGFLIQLLLGGWLGIGNFLPYIASFLSYINHVSIINQQSDAECTPQLQSLYAYYLSQCNWLISASITGYALLGPVGGQLYIYLQSMRWIAFIGGSTVSIAIFCTFYVQRYLGAIVILFGFMFGAGTGLFFGSSIAAAIKWWPQNSGLATGVVIFGMGLGQSVFASIETLYINPDNIPFNGHCGYILQPDILQRIPSCFFVLSATSAILTILATLLFFEKHDAVEYATLDKDDACDATENNHLTWLEAIKTLQFWLLFIECFFMMTILCFVYSEWKVFAQEYLEIEDDHFLLILAMCASFINASGRLLWGMYLDKTRSFGLAMGTATLLATVFLGTMPLCNRVRGYEKVMAFIWICVLYFVAGLT